MDNSVIAAISTPPGEGGIAIIRVSGEGALEKTNRIFEPRYKGKELRERKSFSMSLGWIINEDGERIDEVLLSIMRAPKSYTGEDTVEINCHGGFLPARQCLERVISTGVRVAEAGEFTKRAFLNGRLDASQAEAVIEIIRARSEKALKLAMKQLNGQNSEYISNMEDKIIKANAIVEASLDFPEEVGEPDYKELKTLLEEVKKDIDRVLAAGKRAEIYKEGVKVVICGKPNVGKSSLLNKMLGKERAIVTDLPGTTRDVIEDYINIKGIPVKLIDTAGIREADNLVEKIGVEKTQQVIKDADLVIIVLDAGTGITEEDREVYRGMDKNRSIVMINKDDLEAKNISEEEIKREFPGVKVIRASVKEEKGLEELENNMEEIILSGQLKTDDLEMMVNLRQKDAFVRSRMHVDTALQECEKTTLDCLGVDIWGALEALGEITGKNMKEAVIDRIFSDFCIGK